MKKYEQVIRKYLKERHWDNLRPGDLAKSVAIEAGELLEIFQWTNQTLAEVKRDKAQMEKIKNELADVFNYCFDMTVLLGIDTEKMLMEKLKKVKAKYPAHLFKNRPKDVDAGSEPIYWEIKKKHRMKGE